MLPKNERIIEMFDIFSDKNMKRVMDKVGEQIQTHAKSICPVRTGKLQESISHEATENEAVIYTDVEYAPYVEYGTGIYSELTPADGYWVYIDAEYGEHPPKLTKDRYTYARACQIKNWLVNEQNVPERYVHITNGQEP